MAKESDPPAELQAGRVGRAHGLDGSFYVTSPRPRLLLLGTSVTVAGRSVEIVRRAGTDKRPIVRLDGVEDREGADALRGMALTVDASRPRRSGRASGGGTNWRAARSWTASGAWARSAG